MAAAPAAVETPAASRVVAAALAAAFGSGALVALQSRVNGQLGEVLSDALLAALVSFVVGLVVLVGAVALRPAWRSRLGSIRTLPWWVRLGGLGGALLVAVAALATPLTGVALLTVGIVAGQTAGGLLVDGAGLSPGARRPLTAPRLAGALLCLVAVVLSVSGAGAEAASPWLLVLIVVAGFGTAIQQALNGRVRATTGAAVATLLNFGVGTAALVLAVAAARLVGGGGGADWPGAGEWYLYTGGLMGIVFVAMAAVVVRILGVLRMGLAVVAGQVIGALVLDLTLPAAAHGIGLPTLVGALLTLVAVAVSGLSERSRT